MSDTNISGADLPARSNQPNTGEAHGAGGPNQSLGREGSTPCAASSHNQESAVGRPVGRCEGTSDPALPTLNVVSFDDLFPRPAEPEIECRVCHENWIVDRVGRDPVCDDCSNHEDGVCGPCAECLAALDSREADSKHDEREDK